MWNIQINDVTAIDLECTTFCNLKCPECNRVTDADMLAPILNTSHITLNNCQNWFNPNELTNLNDIRFCGAIDEATMNPELTDILDFFKNEFNIKFVDIRTNGMPRLPAWWADLVNHLPKDHKIMFGLDGLEDTNHLYRVGANWNKIIENAKAFIKAGGQACWQFIEFDHNKHQVEEARQLAHEMGFCEFRTVSSSRPVHTEIKPVRRSGKVSKIQCAKKQITKIQCENQGPYGNRILVNALGQVAPCCFLNGFFHFPFAHSKAEYDHSRNRLPFSFKEPRMTKLYNTHKDTTTDGPAGGLSAISLHCHTLKVILAGKFFADLQASWTTKTPLERCLEVCGKKKIKDEIYPFYFNK